jgi:hypothetical protein
MIGSFKSETKKSLTLPQVDTMALSAMFPSNVRDQFVCRGTEKNREGAISSLQNLV